MAYEGCCGSCGRFQDKSKNIPYDTSNPDYIKGFCSHYHAYYYPTEEVCNHYIKRGGGSGGCYITTMVCNILGYPDNCDVLNTLREFRNTVLQKDKRYGSLLYQYDSVGPMIAGKILDSNIDNRKCGYYPINSIMAEYLQSYDKTFIRGIYDSFLLPIVGFIKNGYHDKAVSQYIKMTKFLQECYEIDFDEKMPSNYDYQRGGHGMVICVDDDSSKEKPIVLQKCRV